VNNFKPQSVAIAMAVATFLSAGILVSPNAASASASALPVAVISASPKPDAAEVLFDPLVVNRIDLTVSQPAIEYLNQHADGSAPGSHGEYQPAKLSITTARDGKTTAVQDVGIRLKGGWGSARDMNGKAAFKVKLNFSVKNQTVFGLKKLTLNNMVQDNSMIHEALGYELFRGVGVAASRTGYARVYVNGVDYGLHLNLETYDEVSLARMFESTKHLYEGAYWQDLVTTPDNYSDHDYTGLQVDEGDAENKDDLKALAEVNTIDTNDPQAVSDWFTAVQRHADLNEILLEWAVERYLAHWDGFGWQIKNNYYVHFDNQGIASILPSGIDQSSTGWLPLFSEDSAEKMFRNCMASQLCTQLYAGALNKVQATAVQLDLPKMAQRLARVIDSDVQSDPRKAQTYADWQWAVQDSVNFHTYRPDQVGYENNTKKPSNASLNYQFDHWLPGQVISANLAQSSANSPVFQVVNNPQTCQIDAATGAVTALSTGWCRVSALVPESDSFGASISYFTFNPGLFTGATVISPLGPIKYSEATAIRVISRSSAQPEFTVSGPCVINDTFITAVAGRGSCLITAKVPADDSFSQSSGSIRVTLARNTLGSYAISKTRYFAGVLPKAAKITLVHRPASISGGCRVDGLKLTAIASKGFCRVVMPKWSDANTVYSAHTFKIALADSTPKFEPSVSKAATVRTNSTFVLSRTVIAKTNWNVVAKFESDEYCQVRQNEQGEIEATDVYAECRVTLTAPKAFGLSGLRRVWVIKPAG
jgi:hypothetical protein